MMAVSVSSSRATRVRPLPRPRKPLTRAERESALDKITKRILQGREPFGVFVIKRGRTREVRLLSVRDPNYAVQMRVNEAQEHWIATYDAEANLGNVWEDLWTFDRVGQ